jgi:hypothetical protein
MLRPHCGIWADPSGRVEIMIRLDHEGQSYTHIVVEPAKDGGLPLIRGNRSEVLPVYIPLEQAAQICSLKRKTLHNWIESGKFRPEHGLRKFGGQYRVELRSFRAAIQNGELGSCS